MCSVLVICLYVLVSKDPLEKQDIASQEVKYNYLDINNVDSQSEVISNQHYIKRLQGATPTNLLRATQHFQWSQATVCLIFSRSDFNCLLYNT